MAVHAASQPRRIPVSLVCDDGLPALGMAKPVWCAMRWRRWRSSPLLTGVRLARFWRTSPLITRASLAAACLWVLIPADLRHHDCRNQRASAPLRRRQDRPRRILEPGPEHASFSRLAAGSHHALRLHPGFGELLRRLRAAVPALPVGTALRVRGPRPKSRASCAPHRASRSSIGWWRVPPSRKPT